MKGLMATLILAPLAVCHASPSPSDSLHSCLLREPELEPPAGRVAGKRLADRDAGEPRTVRMFYFLPNDRPFRRAVVQRIKDEMLGMQAWYGEQMEGHGYGYKTLRLETDDNGDPLVHRVNGQHPDSRYLARTWITVLDEIEASFDLSKSIVVVVVDNSNNLIDQSVAGAAAWNGKEGGIAMVGGEFAWDTLAHELTHTFGLGHDYRDDRYILSYGLDVRSVLSACSAGVLAVHPYFNPDVGLEWGQGPAIELLSATTYREGSQSVPIRLRVSDADGLQTVRVRVRTRETHDARIGGGWETKTCRGLTGEEEAVVEIDYDGVIPSGSAWGFSDLSDPKVHPISIIVIDRDGNRSGHRFQLWELSRQHLATLELAQEVHGLAFVPGATTLASGSGEGVKLWDPARRTRTTTPLAVDVTALAVSSDGATLASGSRSGQVQLFDLRGRRVIATLTGPAHPIRSLAFTRDGRTLASGAPDAIRLWDVEMRTRTATLPAGALSVAFSPDGATLASGSEDGVRLWDVERQTEIATYQHSGDEWGPGVNTVAFSPDGILVASGGDDTTVRLWDVAAGENAAVLEGHERPVRSVSFSADGTLLASGADLVVNLWDPVAKERLVTLRGEGREVKTVAFSPDGTTLAAGSEDGRIGLWDVSEWRASRPQRLVVISGDAQQGMSGEPLAEPLVVEVRDQYGNPLPGVEIDFVVAEGDGRVGARFTLERTTSDPDGRAEVVLTLGPAQGTNTVEVSVPGLEAVSFRAAGIGEPQTTPMEGDISTWQLPDAAITRLGKGDIKDVAFSPNGELLAVPTDIGIWLYDVATSREVALLPTRRLWDIAFSPDGRTLASCGAYKDPIRLWEVATGEETATIDYDATALAFSPDGKTLASGSNYGIEVWDVETRSQRATMSTAEGTWGIHSVAFSPDGRTMAAGSWLDYSVQLWDVETTTKLATMEGHRDEVNSVSFAPDGRTVASASQDHTVRLWDVATQSIAAIFEGHDSWVRSVDFSPDGAFLASASTDVKLWDVATGHATTFSAAGGRVAFSPDGRRLASLSRGGVAIWDLATGNAAAIGGGHFGGGSLSVALSPDGATLASVSYLDVYLWDVATATNTAVLEGHEGRLNSVVFSPDGATLASGASDQTIRLWDVATGAALATLEARGRRAWTSVVAFSPDGRRIASGHGNGTVKVWDLETGTNTVTLEGGHTYAVGWLAFSPDGETLATSSAELAMWDLATETNILTQEDAPEGIYTVSFAPDGTALVLARPSEDPESPVSIWEVPAGEETAALSVEYPGWPSSGAFSPDGSIVLSGNSPYNVDVVEVRDVATGTLIAALEGHGEQVGALAFSGDGSTFASTSYDGTVLVWELQRALLHPRSLTGLSGDDQEGLPNAALPEPLVVEVRDQHGDPLPGVEVVFRVIHGGGNLSVETTETDDHGRAASTLTLGGAPGRNTVLAILSDRVLAMVRDIEAVVFTAETRSTPTTLDKLGGDEQQGPSGSPLDEPFVVSLLDQVGSPYAGATVTFAVTAGDGTLSAATATTDARGRASSTLTLGRTPGPVTVEVTVAGLEPVTFTALGMAIPRSLAKPSGDEQQSEPGAQLSEPLVVSVLDQHGEAYPGAVVTFALAGDGGTLSALTDTTDAEGLAATTLTLGEEPGTYTVVATVTDLEPVTFTASAEASPDFDDDGEVGFSDFFLFAEAFGGSDPRFDLDASGEVDFADFFLLAEHFGQPARAKLVALAREMIGLPEGPQLRQNAPNPFNSGTVISWFQLQSGAARLEVFALTGQRVAVLHHGPRKAGFHHLRWDGRDQRGRLLASGVYLYRLVTTEAVQTRKLTLLR